MKCLIELYCCRFPVRDLPHAVWTLNEKDIDFTDLDTQQVCNHFEGITSLTTKRGFCDLLQEMRWDSENTDDISPRCYNLGDPILREEFIDSFRITAAMNVLRWHLLHNQYTGHHICQRCKSYAPAASTTDSSLRTQTPTQSCSLRRMSQPKPKWPSLRAFIHPTLLESFNISAINQHVTNAITACLWFIRIWKYGEWPSVDISRYTAYNSFLFIPRWLTII